MHDKYLEVNTATTIVKANCREFFVVLSENEKRMNKRIDKLKLCQKKLTDNLQIPVSDAKEVSVTHDFITKLPNNDTNLKFKIVLPNLDKYDLVCERSVKNDFTILSDSIVFFYR